MTDNASVGAKGLCHHVHLNHPVVDNRGKDEMLWTEKSLAET